MFSPLQALHERLGNLGVRSMPLPIHAPSKPTTDWPVALPSPPAHAIKGGRR
ncbi:hypothetical protein OF83DRAFT_1179446 [Amylostereum chailletii]|nr:hypothetical protein OF83DRAFT_1179446 [Amylostereum chailletii]